MPEEIRCPECRGINIEQLPYKTDVCPGGLHGELPKVAEYQKYRCLDCGLLFLESNLKEQR